MSAFEIPVLHSAMPERWKSSEAEKPPLDRMQRCDHLWLYDDAAALPRVVALAGEFIKEAGG